MSNPAARRLLGVALGFFLMGVLLGWFGHAMVSTPREVINRAAEPARPTEDHLVLERLEQIESAIASLESQLAGGAPDGALLRDLGNMFYDLGDARHRMGAGEAAHEAFQRSIEYYEAALREGITSADMLTDLGTMYYRSGDPDRAVSAYGQALEVEPDHPNAWLNIGVVRARALGDDEGAKEAWRRYLEIAPNSPEANRVRAMIRSLEAPSPDG